MSKRRSPQRIHDASAYALHLTPWRETSVIVKVWSRAHGLVLAVGKGAKRPQSNLRTVLHTFQPLRLSWTGRAEVKTLTGAQVAGFLPMPARNYMSGWYLNELILKLVPREDPHPILYDAYEQALLGLAVERPLSATLRQFEWVLLREVGYGLDGPMPDFEDPQAVEIVRARLRERLDQTLADTALQSREVMLGLRQYAS